MELNESLVSLIPTIAGAGAALAVAIVSYFVQRSKLRYDLEHDVAQVKTGFMAERVARELLLQYDAPFRTFSMIRHHIGGFTDDELRRIRVRAGALRFMSKSGHELWALYERVKHYKASWDDAPRNYLSVWTLPVDPSTPHDSLLFPARLTRPSGEPATLRDGRVHGAEAAGLSPPRETYP